MEKTGLPLIAWMDGWMGTTHQTNEIGRQDKFGIFLRKRTTLAMEAFLCLVALAIVVVLSRLLEPYSRGLTTSRGAPRGGECFMMMEWKFLLPVCVLQVKMKY